MEFTHKGETYLMEFQYYSSIINGESYSFSEMDEVISFLVSKDIPKEEIDKFDRFVKQYMSRDVLPYPVYLYFTVLGNDLVINDNHLYIRERILTHKKNYELVSNGLLHIIECSSWRTEHLQTSNFLTISYKNDEELKHKIYIYKDYIMICRSDGSNKYIYNIKSFKVIKVNNF